MTAWPCRFDVMSYNLWNTARWEWRRAAAEAFFRLHRPDVLGIQELRAETREFLDAALPQHARVDDPLPGWTCESNLWWHRERFELVEHGAEPIEHYEQHRRLFWVRLRPTWPGAPELLVACVHFTWTGNPTEKAGGVSPRYRQAALAAAALERLRRSDQPALIMGDLNDFCHPLRLLKEAGYQPACELLGQAPQVTWPAFYVTNDAPQPIDWMLVKGPLRPLAYEVLDYQLDGIPPSDHRAIHGVFELAA